MTFCRHCVVDIFATWADAIAIWKRMGHVCFGKGREREKGKNFKKE